MRAIQLFRNSRKPETQRTVIYIGKDRLGNRYFEVEAPANQWRKTQRYFEREVKDESTFVVDKVRVPPVWDAWLRFRRKDPPTEEEQRESEEYFLHQQALAAKRASDIKTTQDNDEARGKKENSVMEDSKMPKKRPFPKLPYPEL